MGLGSTKGGAVNRVYKYNHCALCSGRGAPEGTETDSPRVSAAILWNKGMQKSYQHGSQYEPSEPPMINQYCTIIECYERSFDRTIQKDFT